MDILNGKIYVKDLYHENINVYNPEKEQWNRDFSAPQRLSSFAMAMMNDQLVLAGGVHEEHRYSTTVNLQSGMSPHRLPCRLGSTLILPCQPLAAVRK